MYLEGVVLNVAATSKIDQPRPLVWKAAQQLLLKPKLELFVTVSFLLMTHDKPHEDQNMCELKGVPGVDSVQVAPAS